MKRIAITIIVLVTVIGTGVFFINNQDSKKSSFIDEVTASEITAAAVCNCSGGSGDIGGTVSGGYPGPDGKINIADYVVANRYFNGEISLNNLSNLDVAPLLRDEDGNLIFQEGTNMVTQNCDGVVNEEDYKAIILAAKLGVISFSCQP